MKKKAGMSKTKFGDCYDPAHVERIEKFTKANMS
jgi:hypothetical protein